MSKKEGRLLRYWRSQVWPWWWLIALAILFVVVWWLVPPLLYSHAPGTDEARLKAITDTRTALLAGLIGLGALLTFWLNNRLARITSRTLEVTEQGHITDRYARAIDQLGSERVDVRIGGIYALKRVANDSPDDWPTIAEVLSAYVRGRSPWPPSLPGQYVAEAPIDDIPELQVRSPDVQAAVAVLGRGPDAAEPISIDLNGVDLRCANLMYAKFDNAGLNGSRLQRANLFGAHLRHATLVNAQLQRAAMDGAQLQNSWIYGAQLEGAWLSGANLTEAQLESPYTTQESAGLRGAWANESTVWPAG